MELLSPTNEESEDSPIWSHMIAFRIGTLPPIRISYSSIHIGDSLSIVKLHDTESLKLV
jgi:hypothetical protein